MSRDGRPNPDPAVTRLPENPVYGAAGTGRGVVGLREVGEDEVLEPVRCERQSRFGRLLVREVAVLRGYTTLQSHRVRTPSQPVGVVVGLEDHRLGAAHVLQDLWSNLAEIGGERDVVLAVRDPQPVRRRVVRDLE